MAQSIFSMGRLKRQKDMYEELDTVVLARDIEKHGLKRGDIGASYTYIAMVKQWKWNLSLPKEKQ